MPVNDENNKEASGTPPALREFLDELPDEELLRAVERRGYGGPPASIVSAS